MQHHTETPAAQVNHSYKLYAVTCIQNKNGIYEIVLSPHRVNHLAVLPNAANHARFNCLALHDIVLLEFKW